MVVKFGKHLLLLVTLTTTGCVTSRPTAVEVERVTFAPTEITLTESLSSPSTSSESHDGETSPSATIQLASGLESGSHANDELLSAIPDVINADPTRNRCPIGSDRLVTLVELEQLALDNNPTLKQAEASIVRAGGLATQVGRPANPTVGYFANQLADEGTDQQGIFFEQQIVRGGKLELNQQVLSQTRQFQIWELESQRLRVQTDVRVLYFEASAAQERLAAAEEFVSLTAKAAEISAQRVEAMEDSRIDLLQTRIQLNEVELLRRNAEISFVAAWEELTALTGVPCKEPGRLVPAETAEASAIDWCFMYDSLQANSPELAASLQKVSRARALLSRQEVQAIPNLTVQLGAGVDNSTDSGLINLQLSGPLPIYNQNQGNVTAAYAEYCRATHEVARIRSDLKARLARVSKEYDSSRVTVAKYSEEILPQAEEALDLATSAYELGETDFLQLLVIRRSFFEARLAEITARKELAQAQARLDGMLLTGALAAPESLTDGDELRGQSLSGE